MTEKAHSSTGPFESRESGSAYVITLMVLFVLTVLGLSLALITQGEADMASQERTIERTFYAADSGIWMAAARVLQQDELSSFDFNLADPLDLGTLQAFDRDDVLQMSDEVEVEQVYPTARNPCNYCPINQDNEYYEVTHAMASQATRQGALVQSPNSDPVPMARATITAMVDMQPRQTKSGYVEAAARVGDDAAKGNTLLGQ